MDSLSTGDTYGDGPSSSVVGIENGTEAVQGRSVECGGRRGDDLTGVVEAADDGDGGLSLLDL